MEKTIEAIAGDTPGTDYSLSVLRFAGSDPSAPSAYLQAALHGNELPGVAALHVLIPLLAAAEAEGRLRGRVTIVPFANPIGLGQYLFGEHQGRFGLGSRTNFNRDFPLIDAPDASLIAEAVTAEKRLKARLLSLALGHDLVLDLHCDDQSLPYLYIPAVLWPQMSDLAAALGAEAVLLFEGGTDASFDEANIRPYLRIPAEEARLKGRAVTTVELRGIADVSPEIAEADGTGLYRFLVGRGIVLDERVPAPYAYAGAALPQTHIEMIRAPRGGMLLYHVAPGDTVTPGAPLATIVTVPGEPGGSTTVLAEVAGRVLTRRSQRSVRIGDDILKIMGPGVSKTATMGALED